MRRGDRRLNADGLPGHAVKRKMDLPFPNSYSFALNTIARVNVATSEPYIKEREKQCKKPEVQFLFPNQNTKLRERAKLENLFEEAK